jgi:hypothetical protein
VASDDDTLLSRARQLLAQNPQRARIIIMSWLNTEPLREDNVTNTGRTRLRISSPT